MARNGFIKLHRAITEWEWYKDTNTKNVFLHLLLSANFEPSRFHGYEIGVGQCFYSLENLANSVGLSKQQTRTTLQHLISTREITYQRTPLGLIISIENWSKYQGNQHDLQHENNTQSTFNQHYQKKLRNKEIKNSYNSARAQNKSNNKRDVSYDVDEFTRKTVDGKLKYERKGGKNNAENKGEA